MTQTQPLLFVAILALVCTGRTYLAAGQRSPQKPHPVFLVQATYPGASAQVVADNVVAPLEQQLTGVKGLQHLIARCSNNGDCTLKLTFAPNIDLHEVQQSTQERIARATPTLPDLVIRRGVTIRQQSPGPLAFVQLSSPAGRHDTLYLSNYANIQIRDELVRLPGVSDVVLLGQRDYGLRIWLDPDRLAATQLTAADVLRALREQNVQVQGGQIGQPPKKGQNDPLLVQTLGRLTAPADFENVVLARRGGQLVRLRDVASVELGASELQSQALFNGEAAVLLTVSPTAQAQPRELSTALRARLTQLRNRLPDGLRLEVPFDFTANWTAPEAATTPRYLLLDVALPPTASAERTRQALERCAALLRKVNEVNAVLAVSENPFAGSHAQPCLLVQLAAAASQQERREQVKNTIRKQFQTIPDLKLRLRDLSGPNHFPRCEYPLRLTLHGPDAERVQAWASQLVEKLQPGNKVTDLWLDPRTGPQPLQHLEVDRTAAARQGVTVADIASTLQAQLGSLPAGDFNRFGRTWQVTIHSNPRGKTPLTQIKQLKVRNAQGQMVPLSTLVTIRETTAPGIILRWNGQPLQQLTANPAAGVSLAEARALCERLTEELRREWQLPPEYRRTWLSE